MKRKLRLSRNPYVQMLIPTPFLLAFLCHRVQKIKILNFSVSLSSTGVAHDPVLANETKAEDPREGFPS